MKRLSRGYLTVLLFSVVPAGCGLSLDYPNLPVLDNPGTVFQCYDQTPNTDDVQEWCWRDGDAGAIEAELGRQMGVEYACVPTQRTVATCLYQCPAPPHGCNALNGCLCTD